MKFKVCNKERTEWWVWDDCYFAYKESEAFIFDTNNPEHMENVGDYITKDRHIIKLVANKE